MGLNRFFVVFGVCLLLAAGCSRSGPPAGGTDGRLQVVTTLFPLYDMARAIGGSRADVRLLLPPGVEPHHFEPRPDDIIAINKASLFIYTNRYMEPWAEKLVKGIATERLRVVDASASLTLHRPGGEQAGRHTADDGHPEHAGEGIDPHVWLDLGNAVQMVDEIQKGFVAGDPANRSYYEANAAAYRKKLQDIDQHFSATLGACRHRVLLHAGHYAFGYLAGRYKLEYVAATGMAADAEPTPARLAALVKQIRQTGIRTVFTEELVSPKLAEAIAGETGAQIVLLHAGHNISREELSRGITFPELMEQNLAALEKGLQCRQ